ncbi:AbrB family transcriptional regulator [Acidithiobacillus thiooxidans]|uniref:AbrB family transcriptional regulator n=1 Tax=Acidithiobacillus thiooxidans TaxID=930 RepID=UPI001C06FAAD|nr:AbrB family transcriptional regulator [Acidithiobacillus thiooxidans]MBU2751719.1 AbrB family transcriptional regulator [Acidithiobacillus thiooxidans]
MVNPFASATAFLQNEFDNLAQSALPVIAVAIFALVAAIVGFWFLARLFGFDVGLSETAKQRIRDKAKRRKSAFPVKFSRRSKDPKVAREGGPWSDPADASQDNIYGANVEELDLVLSNLSGFKKTGEAGTYFEADRGYRVSSQRERDYAAVESAYSLAFPDKSLKGFFESNVSYSEKLKIAYHAARVSKMRLAALAENHKEWAIQYGDGMAPKQSRLVA